MNRLKWSEDEDGQEKTTTKRPTGGYGQEKTEGKDSRQEDTDRRKKTEEKNGDVGQENINMRI
jgi:hypothetical protein